MTVMAEALYRPQRLRRAIAILGLALLGACSTIVPRTAPPTRPMVAAPDVPPVTGPIAPLPEDKARHRIALLVPMSGPNAAVGQSIANAANLALLDTGGATLRITTYDTASGAGAAAARAIAEGNRLFLGPLLADDVRAVAGAARAARVPVVAFSNDETVAGNGTYLLGFSPRQSIDRVVRYAAERGSTRFAGLTPTAQYGRNASSELIRVAEAAGGQVVAMQSYERTPVSLNAAIKRLGTTQGYDAVLIADGGRFAIQAVPLLRRGAGAKARVLGTELWATETSLNQSAALSGAWFASVPETMYRQLATKYRARYGRAPYRLASLGYDAVLLATRIAGDWRVGTAFPERALTVETGFSGVDGAFRFGRDGIAERALAVHQVGTGGFTVVSPAPRGFSGK